MPVNTLCSKSCLQQSAMDKNLFDLSNISCYIYMTCLDKRRNETDFTVRLDLLEV